MNNGSSDSKSKKKNKKKAPIRDVRMVQDNTRVSLSKIKEPNVRARYLNAIEGGIKHLKSQLNRLEFNEPTPSNSKLKYKKNMTPAERVEIGKKMERIRKK